MKNISIWKDSINNNKEYFKLDKNIDTDVLIIGGGITGVSTLYHLRDSNLKCVLVEQNKIGYSTTSNSTGKLSYLQNDLLDKIRKNTSDIIASIYLKSQIQAINNLVDTIKKENIDCDLLKTKSYLYTNKDNEINKIKDLELFLNKNNIETKTTTNNIVDSKYMIEVDNTYLINPLKLVYGLLNNNKYPIYENTSIKKIKKYNDYYICYSDNYKIKAKYVILATHYPYFLKPMFFPLKCRLEKSYLSASLYKSKNISLISYSNPFISIRNYKEYLIYLTNSSRVSKNVCDKTNFNDLIKKLNNKGITPNYLWSNTDLITNDYMPYIGRIKDNLLLATGYNTWGLSSGFMAGNILSDIILNKKNELINIYNPNRFNISNISGGILNMLESMEGYINGFLYSDNKKVCPHMKCKLIYNEIENSYDCPCHGSRFNKDGKVIMSPANKDID